MRYEHSLLAAGVSRAVSCPSQGQTCVSQWCVQAYLGSESEEEEDPGQADAERYRQLLTGATDVHRPAAKGWGGAADQDEEEVSSQVLFPKAVVSCKGSAQEWPCTECSTCIVF